MTWTLPAEKVGRPALWLAAALAVSASLRQTGFYNFTAREVEGLNTLIQLVGDIYAVLLAFTIFVIWGQFTEVENASCASRTCSTICFASAAISIPTPVRRSARPWQTTSASSSATNGRP